MATEQSLHTISLEADANLAASQYRAVVLSGDGQAALAGASVNILGILQDDPAAAGRAATIGIHGISIVEAGAAFAVGANLSTDADGQLVTTPGAGSVPIVALALQAAGAATERVRALLGFRGLGAA